MHDKAKVLRGNRAQHRVHWTGGSLHDQIRGSHLLCPFIKSDSHLKGDCHLVGALEME
jgi:hypothetical protein